MRLPGPRFPEHAITPGAIGRHDSQARESGRLTHPLGASRVLPFGYMLHPEEQFDDVFYSIHDKLEDRDFLTLTLPQLQLSGLQKTCCREALVIFRFAACVTRQKNSINCAERPLLMPQERSSQIRTKVGSNPASQRSSWRSSRSFSVPCPI